MYNLRGKLLCKVVHYLLSRKHIWSQKNKEEIESVSEGYAKAHSERTTVEMFADYLFVFFLTAESTA